jgi:hypothetical protein
MWSKKGMPVDADARPPPSTSSTRSIVVSLVVRCCSDVRAVM